jgi:hypothetical protein
MGRHGHLRVLEQGFSAGRKRGLPGLYTRGAVALGGERPLPSPQWQRGFFAYFLPWAVLHHSAFNGCPQGLVIVEEYSVLLSIRLLIVIQSVIKVVKRSTDHQYFPTVSSCGAQNLEGWSDVCADDSSFNYYHFL